VSSTDKTNILNKTIFSVTQYIEYAISVVLISVVLININLFIF